MIHNPQLAASCRLVLAVVTLTAVAALASFLPAYRASRLDPLKALRYE